MTLQRLARELDETARQTAVLVDAVGDALAVLSDKKLSADYVRQEAMAMIVAALQGQDRIEQRCQNMALAVRQFALLPPTTPDSVYDEIWASLVLDELRVPSLSGVAAKPSRGEVELFCSQRTALIQALRAASFYLKDKAMRGGGCRNLCAMGRPPTPSLRARGREK
jgi:hypothetical protein